MTNTKPRKAGRSQMPKSIDFYIKLFIPNHSVDDSIYRNHVTLPSSQWQKGKVAGARCCTALLAPIMLQTNCCPTASVRKQRSILSRLHTTSSNPAYVERSELLSSSSELSKAILTVRVQLCNLKRSQKTEIHTLCWAPDVLTNAWTEPWF